MWEAHRSDAYGFVIQHFSGGALETPWLSSSPHNQPPRPGDSSSRSHCLCPGSDPHHCPDFSFSPSCPSSPEWSCSFSQSTNNSEQEARASRREAGGLGGPRPSFALLSDLPPHTSLDKSLRQWHPTPILLPGKSHGWRSLVDSSPWGRKELDTTE